MHPRVIGIVAAVAIGAAAVVFVVTRREPVREGAAPPAPVGRSATEPRPAPPRPEPAPTPTPSAPRVRAKPTPAPAPASDAPPAAAKTGATLQVESDVPGASVFLDREYVGTAPLTLEGLKPGTRRLNATAAGHEGQVETVTLVEGANTVNIEFRKVRLNASMPVVHRHGMGSCQGMLAATVNGLAYQTANKSDAFSIGFGQLEQFEVDYLKKNLRVKQRGGKTWNFTTTGDSADPLFVFHRDVQKARDKTAEQ